MDAIIKAVRQMTGLGQQDFADALGVSFTSVNRWENGHSVPNHMAQSRIYDFCRAKGIPLETVVYAGIAEQAAGVAAMENRMILYHGSKSGIQGRIMPLSRDRCDFGRGFYMGTDLRQCLTLISDFAESKLYVVSLKLDGLRMLRIPPDIEWALFVAYNRGKMDGIRGTRLYQKYERMAHEPDIVVGSIADDRMFYVLDNFFQGNITDKALVASLSALRLGEQYAAVTQAGCDAVSVEREISLSYLERRCLQDVSQEKRLKGVSLADEVCRRYRREGLFFDEILEQEKEVR